MNNQRWTWPRALAALYFLWGTFVFFGTLGTESHAWWPVTLHIVTYPLGLAIWGFLDLIFDGWLYSAPRPEHSYVLEDYAAGALYILGGTVWVWAVCSLISRGINRLRARSQQGHEA